MRTLAQSAFILSIGASLLGCPSPSPSGAGSTSGEAPPPAQPEHDRPGPWMSAAPPGPSASAEPPAREIVGAAHILVSYKGALGAPKTIFRTKEAAKRRCEEALVKLKSDKTAFEKLVNEYSDDTSSKPAKGALGNFERNVMPQAFSDAAFSLPVGGFSEVVETPRGFHIVVRTK